MNRLCYLIDYPFAMTTGCIKYQAYLGWLDLQGVVGYGLTADITLGVQSLVSYRDSSSVMLNST